MSSFSSGPWKIYGQNQIIMSPIEDIPAHKQTVRYIAQVFGQGMDVNLANAKLIAASPEMYGVLEELSALPDEGCMIGVLSRKSRDILARINGGAENAVS